MIKFLLLTLLVACTPEEAKKYEQNMKESFQHKCDGYPIETRKNGLKVYAYEALEDGIGVYKKYRYYKLKDSDSCIKQEVQLSYFEKSLRKRARLNIQCTPQTFINEEVYLAAANNYYEYRNDRLFFHINPFTGIYQRISYGEDEEGNILHNKEEGCWYIREDREDELWGAVDYGIQIYFERPKSASSNLSKPNEIYRITRMDNDWHMTSFDETREWTYAFCPYLSSSWGFCDLLRNGNFMFDSNISDIQKDQLLAEALLIRTQYNFVKMPREEFEDKWDQSMNYTGEEPQIDFKYKVTYSPDAQFYTEQAWIDYIKGDRPYMPDTNIIVQRPVCYKGFKRVILDDGSSSLIRGEICYIDGEYNFTEF
jgi:hypothetical protein